MPHRVRRQFLAHGRYRAPLRPLLGDSSTITAITSPAARPARPTRMAIASSRIWNLVFMQFEQLESGEQIGLPSPLDPIPGWGSSAFLTAVIQGTHDKLRHRHDARPDRAGGEFHQMSMRTARNPHRTASSPTICAPVPSSSLTGCCPRTRDAATCCAGSCAPPPPPAMRHCPAARLHAIR